MRRGEIWWASMGEPAGSSPGYRRPVVIASTDDFNNSLIQTVIAVVVTSNLKLAEAPGNFKIGKSRSGLDRESVVNISQIITLDKMFLTERIGQLGDKQLNKLNEGLRLALGL